MSMRLTRVYLTRGGFRDDGPLTGSITVKGPKSETQIRVSEEAASRIVELCAEGIVEAAHEVSQIMIDDVVGVKKADSLEVSDE